jgi:cell division topological specificity factor
MELKEVFGPIINFIKSLQKKERECSKVAAKERLKLVLMQDRASVSPDFFEMMKKEIIDVIKKYIEIDEETLEVELTRGFEDGLEGPALYANIPIKSIKPVARKPVEEKTEESEEENSNMVTKEENIESEVVANEDSQVTNDESQVTNEEQEEETEEEILNEIYDEVEEETEKDTNEIEEEQKNAPIQDKTTKEKAKRKSKSRK